MDALSNRLHSIYILSFRKVKIQVKKRYKMENFFDKIKLRYPRLLKPNLFQMW